MFIKIPDYVSHTINKLNNTGYKAYIVGGCVRDALLCKEPNDWDICTSALPEQTMEVFKDYKMVTNGLKHGTVCVIINHHPIEITTFRIDGEYKDNRRPQDVTFTPSLAEDLKRRDFTINAMAYSEKEGLIDFNNGINDLKNGIIRCVGEPEKRFDEDALRIMRALRFSAQLRFEIEQKTKEAIFKKSALLKNISAERITDEFTKLILSDNYYIVLAEYKDIIKEFLPHFQDGISDKLPDNDLRLRLAHVLSASECKINDAFGILKLPKATKAQVKVILENINSPIPADKLQIKKLLTNIGEETVNMIFVLKKHLGKNIAKQQNILDEIIKSNECYTLKQLDISGKVIIELGIINQKNVGKVLDYLLEEVMSGRIQNKEIFLTEAAKEYINKYFK